MTAPAGPQPTQPGAMEIAGWNGRRNAARQRYSNALAGTTFQRAEMTRQNDVNVANQARGQQAQRSTFGDSYASRGLMKSGIYGRGLRNFYMDMAEQQRSLSDQYLSGMGGLGIQELQNEGSLTEQLGSIDAEEQARRSELAAEIRGVT